MKTAKLSFFWIIACLLLGMLTSCSEPLNYKGESTITLSIPAKVFQSVQARNADEECSFQIDAKILDTNNKTLASSSQKFTTEEEIADLYDGLYSMDFEIPTGKTVYAYIELAMDGTTCYKGTSEKVKVSKDGNVLKVALKYYDPEEDVEEEVEEEYVEPVELLEEEIDLNEEDYSVSVTIAASKFSSANDSCSLKFTLEECSVNADWTDIQFKNSMDDTTTLISGTISGGTIESGGSTNGTEATSNHITPDIVPGTFIYTPTSEEWSLIKEKGLVVYGYGAKITSILLGTFEVEEKTYDTSLQDITIAETMTLTSTSEYESFDIKQAIDLTNYAYIKAVVSIPEDSGYTIYLQFFNSLEEDWESIGEISTNSTSETVYATIKTPSNGNRDVLHIQYAVRNPKNQNTPVPDVALTITSITATNTKE